MSQYIFIDTSNDADEPEVVIGTIDEMLIAVMRKHKYFYGIQALQSKVNRICGVLHEEKDAEIERIRAL